MRWIVGALGVAALVVVAAGCFGGPGTARPPRPDTRVVIRTSVGGPARRIAELDARCPAQARCRPERLPGPRPRRWALVATRRLTCDPDRGDYPRPAPACRALRDLARLETHPTGIACACPVMTVSPPTIVGRVDGRHVAFTLGCGLCGLPSRAAADAGVLTPA